MRAAATRRGGYSLMEAIVALFVLAVASTGLLMATQAHIDGGAVVWPGDLDLAPDAMYQAIKSQGEWVLR